MENVYKIMTPSEWAGTQAAGVFAGSSLDLRDGYIHLSTAAQAVETASRHFADRGDLMLVAVGVEGLGEALRWEPSRGGDLFPHAYRALTSGDIVWAKPFDSRRLETLRALLPE